MEAFLNGIGEFFTSGSGFIATLISYLVVYVPTVLPFFTALFGRNTKIVSGLNKLDKKLVDVEKNNEDISNECQKIREENKQEIEELKEFNKKLLTILSIAFNASNIPASTKAMINSVIVADENKLNPEVAITETEKVIEEQETVVANELSAITEIEEIQKENKHDGEISFV